MNTNAAGRASRQNAIQMAHDLAPYGPQHHVQILNMEVNKIYHQIEAVDYDRSHPEILQQLPALWREMLGQLPQLDLAAPYRVLDYGCGTGFEAATLLKLLPPGSVQQLTCFDPSAAMLERCRAKVSPLTDRASFVTDLADGASAGPFDLVISNSLLHHLPDPIETMKEVGHRASREAVWLSGHEPSRRFYANAECNRVFSDFSREQRWRRFLSPRKYLSRVRRIRRPGMSPAGETARLATEAGLFTSPPTPELISRLVDFNVASSPADAAAERGFDFQQMATELSGHWELAWVRTYGFMGNAYNAYEAHLPEKWRFAAQSLARRFPYDGTTFAAIWRRPRL